MSATLIAESLEGMIETFAERLLEDARAEAERASRRHWLVATRLAWAGMLLLSLGLFVISVPLRYHQLRSFDFTPLPRSDILRAVNPEPLRHALAQLGLSTTFFAWYSLTLEVFFAAIFCGVAALIVARRAHTWWTMFIVLMLVVFGTSSMPTLTALAGMHPVIDLLARINHMLAWALIEIFLFLFPNGRFVPRWTRWASAIWLVWMLATAIFPTSIVSPFSWPDQLAFLLWTVAYGGAALSQLYRYRRFANQVERLQSKWTLFSVVVAVFGTLLVNIPWIFAPTAGGSAAGALCELIRIPAGGIFILVMPVTVGIAILRYRLWEIDLLISQTLVYVPLTAILGGLYTASISMFQRLFVALTGNTSDVAIVFTTLVVASAFTPVKNGLQRAVDGRFKPAHEHRTELQSYREQLEGMLELLDLRQAMQHLLETSVATLGATGGAIYLGDGERARQVRSAGEWQEQEPSPAAVSVPLEWAGVTIGRIAVGPKRNGQVYSEAELDELRRAARHLAHLTLLQRRANPIGADDAAEPRVA